MRSGLSITGEIVLLYEERDRYGEVLLLGLDPDDPGALSTFELHGQLAARWSSGRLKEGMRVRVECRPQIVEMINLDTGETSERERPVVVDLAVLEG